MIEHKKAIENTQKWVENVVVGLNLCPFAKREFVNNRVRFEHTFAQNEEELVLKLHEELEFLVANPETETTLLIHPEVLTDFYDYIDFLELCEAMLEELDLIGVFQIASFHPEYQFEDTVDDAPENYTNRSPHPMLHILREASLELAIDAYPDTEMIPQRNIDLMNQMGLNQLQALLQNCISQ